MAETKEMFKPKDVEELIDWYFHRPLAAHLVRVVEPTPLTPNQLTVLALIFGSASGFAFYAGGTNNAWVVVGAILLFSSIIFDCADGQLARVRGTASMLGRALDGIADYFPTISAFYGLAFFIQQRMPELGWWTWILGYSAGASMIWHCFLYDGIKNVYLRNTKPPVDGMSMGWLDMERVEAEWAEIKRSGRILLWAIYWLFVVNTRAQHKHIAKEHAKDGPLTSSPEEREIYRDAYLSSMRLWSHLGLGTHLFLLVTASLLAAIHPGAPLVIWLIMIVPMNALTLWLLVTAPRRYRRVRATILQRRALEAARAA
ncbi:MAG: hypothetical protein AMXMBFR64_11180 [Myxococcales bacterium]